MANSISFKMNGIEKAIGNISGKIASIEKEIQSELNSWGQNTANEAKRLTPVDEGKLRGSINPTVGKLNNTVTVGVNYAAYIEFGTRKFAAAYVSSLPQDWQTFAAIFKGKAGGGSFEEFLLRITEWVKRKKIGATFNTKTRRRDRVGKQSAATTANADAYAIALHILRNGIRPHPFLYPASEKTGPELIKRITEILK